MAKVPSLLGFLLLIPLFLYHTSIASVPDSSVFSSQAKIFSFELVQLLDGESGINDLRQAYAARKDDITFATLDGGALVQELASNLGELLLRKMKALNRSVEFAEKVAAAYSWNPALTLADVNYTKSKEVNESDPSYVYSAQFKQLVNFNTSSVHIPVEIYEGDIEILNGLEWTNALDTIWRKNFADDPSLLWQYFGSQTGIMRNYPASKWRGTGVDLYDVRRRPWYTQGASSPKDMLILVDTSGSTHGQALALMKQSVVSLLNTLGENDFVNVAHFADKAKWVGCFDTFVQATYRNKKELSNYVDKLYSNGMASYSKGFEFAFSQFELFDKDENRTEGEGANCNRIIMFLTDGGTEMPEEVFDKYNRPEAKIRIFAYAVGPTANPIAAVKWIACTNRGYFYRIPAMGAIRSTVQMYQEIIMMNMALSNVHYLQFGDLYKDYLDYYRYIGRVLAFEEVRDTKWTNIYPDQWHYATVLGRSEALNEAKPMLWSSIHLSFHKGLGMMTTVTLPVYNKTLDVANQTILGVMGSDVTVKEMTEFIPDRLLGPNGYSFAINSNGYIVFHPNLKAVFGWLEDPPNVDFLEVEYETESKVEIRKSMIDSATGAESVTSYVVLPDQVHVDNATRTYYYTAVPDSTFSVAVVLPNYAKYYIKKVPPTEIFEGVQLIQPGETFSFLSTWDYCAQLQSAPGNDSTPLDDLIQTIELDYDSCDQDLIQHLFMDAAIVDEMLPKWKENIPGTIEAAFVATNAGLTKVFPASANESLEHLRDPWSTVYYKRAFDNEDLWMFSTDLVRTDDNYTTIMVTKAISMPDTGYKPAVMGLLLSQETLKAQVEKAFPSCTSLQNKCYLLDDGGFIVMSTDMEEDYDKIGMFFGEVERDLMAQLISVNYSVYIQKEEYDYQGACPEEKPTASAGNSLISPIFYDMLSVHWWTTKIAWAFLNFNFYNWLFPAKTQYAEAAYDDPPKNYSCVLKLAQYHYNTQKNTDARERLHCEGCLDRSYATARVLSTNLMVVMVEVNRECDRICTRNPLLLRPVETSDPNFSDGQCKVKQRYRKRPPCYGEHNENEDSSLCGSASWVSPNWLLLSLLLLISQRVFNLLPLL